MKLIIIVSACIGSLSLYAAHPQAINNLLAQKAAFTSAMNRGDRTTAAQALEPLLHPNIDYAGLYADKSNRIETANQAIAGLGFRLFSVPLSPNPQVHVSGPQSFRLACIVRAVHLLEINKQNAQTRIDNNYDCTGIPEAPYVPDVLPTEIQDFIAATPLKPVTSHAQASHDEKTDASRLGHNLFGTSGNNSATAATPLLKPASPTASRVLLVPTCCGYSQIYGLRMNGPCDCCCGCLLYTCWKCHECCYTKCCADPCKQGNGKSATVHPTSTTNSPRSSLLKGIAES